MGHRGLKINISGIKMHHFFVPELMAAAVLVKTIVFEQFLIFLIFLFFLILGLPPSQARALAELRLAVKPDCPV